MYQRQCLWCGKDFETHVASAKFHSGVCKQAYWRWKHNLDLAEARVNASLRDVHSYISHEATANEAWDALLRLKSKIDWLLQQDEVGTKVLFPDP